MLVGPLPSVTADIGFEDVCMLASSGMIVVVGDVKCLGGEWEELSPDGCLYPPALSQSDTGIKEGIHQRHSFGHAGHSFILLLPHRLNTVTPTFIAFATIHN